MNKAFAALCAVLALACTGHGEPAYAQADFPSRPLSIIVPFSAGGPTDTVARTVADAMTRAWPGSAVVVENVSGAGGTVGASRVARGRPDGHTLLLHHIGMATAPALYRKLSFDPLKDFEFIGLVTNVPMTVLVNKDVPVKGIAELGPYVKAHAARLTLANAGIGAASHLCGLMLQSALGQRLATTPYRGTGPAITDLESGRADILCDQTTNTTPHIEAGKVRALAVTSAHRVPTLKDLPTMMESGFKEFDITIWHGLYAPAGTPRAVVDKLSAALQKALADDGVRKRFSELGAVAVPAASATPQALRKQLASEIDRWNPVIQQAGAFAD